MTDEPGRRRIRVRDYTEAMTRPHVVSRWGPGEKDKLPAAIRPTNQQVMLAFGLVLGVGVIAWRLPPIRLMFGWAGPWLWFAFWLAVACVAVSLWHRKPIDERTLARSLESFLAFRTRSRGRTEGQWLVHGQVHRNTRRLTRRRPAAMIPAREDPS